MQQAKNPKEINVFDAKELARLANAAGNVQLETGSVLNIHTNTYAHGMIATAPTHLIDYCRGGVITGIVRRDNMWHTIDKDGKVGPACAPVWQHASK